MHEAHGEVVVHMQGFNVDLECGKAIYKVVDFKFSLVKFGKFICVLRLLWI